MKIVYPLSFVLLLITSNAAMAAPREIIVHDKLPANIELYCALGYTKSGKLIDIRQSLSPMSKEIGNKKSVSSISTEAEKVVLLVSKDGNIFSTLFNKSLMSLRTNRDVEFKAWSLECTGDIQCTVLPGRVGTLRIKVDHNPNCPSIAKRMYEK